MPFGIPLPSWPRRRGRDGVEVLPYCAPKGVVLREGRIAFVEFAKMERGRGSVDVSAHQTRATVLHHWIERRCIVFICLSFLKISVSLSYIHISVLTQTRPSRGQQNRGHVSRTFSTAYIPFYMRVANKTIFDKFSRFSHFLHS